jgi:hypothetical protein
MDVRLRAVPSPPPQPVEPTTPRIRLPGYPAPQFTPGASMVAQPPGGIVAVGPTDARLQTVQISALLAPPYAAATTLPTGGNSIAGGDGFRPRTSMR